MKRQAYQHPELRDANDNIIQQGTYGKTSPLVNSDNTGVLDYINNNLEALYDNLNGSRIYVANKAALPATGDLSAMYIAEDTGKWYLWDGQKYLETDNARKIADEAIAARDAAKASANDAANSAREQQADWNVTDTTSQAFIKNKPDVLTYEFEQYQANAHTPFKNNCIQSIGGSPSEELPDDVYKWGVQATLGKIGSNSGGNVRIYLPHRGGIYFKNCWSNDDGSGWHTVIDDKNFTSYALPKDGTAVKATADAAGNNIQTTYATKQEAGNYLPLSGGTMSGAITTTANPGLKMRNNDSYLVLCGASSYKHGAHILLNGKNSPHNEGSFSIAANDGSGGYKILTGKPDGTLTWNDQPLLPIGVVQAFAGSTIPNGWLLCDGSAVSRTTYANLYACIGDTYGAGNGSTTFNLPNLVDQFVEGSATAGTVKSAGLPNITGSIGGGTGAGGPAGSGSGVGFLRDTMISGCFQPSTYQYGNETGSGGQTVPSGYPVLTANLDASRSSAIYGKSTTVQPPALTMRYIIKY